MDHKQFSNSRLEIEPRLVARGPSGRDGGSQSSCYACGVGSPVRIAGAVMRWGGGRQ